MVLILALIAVAIAFALGLWVGRAWRAPPPRGPGAELPPAALPSRLPPAAAPALPPVAPPLEEDAPAAAPRDGAIAERARVIRSFEREAAVLRQAGATQSMELAAARADAARYRQLVVDLENDAPPPLLGGPGTPDDLKLIVGVGPVLERMLYQLGITTYRQIARWGERDIDEFDAKLPEFPGRIRRDAWVTQARELHQSKYGTSPRDRP